MVTGGHSMEEKVIEAGSLSGIRRGTKLDRGGSPTGKCAGTGFAVGM